MDLRNWEMYAGSGNPLVGATVKLYSAVTSHPNAGTVLQQTLTDASGMWQFTGLTDGDYDVKVELPGTQQAKWYKGLVRLGVSELRAVQNWVELIGQSSVAAPASGRGRLYVKTDGRLYHQYASGGEKLHPASGEIANADIAANAAIDLTKLGAMKYCMMQTDTTPDQSISNATWTDVNFVNELDDPFNMHSGTDTYITIPETGLWFVAVTLFVVQNAANARYILGLPGLIGAGNFITANNPSHDPYTLLYATVGKITGGTQFRVQIWHNNGSTISISNAYQPRYVIAKVGSL